MSEFLDTVVYFLVMPTFVAPIVQLLVIIYTSITKKWRLSYKLQGILIGSVIVGFLGCMISESSYGGLFVFLKLLAMGILLAISLLIHWIVEKVKSKSNPNKNKKLLPLWIPFAIIIICFIWSSIFTLVQNNQR